MNHYERENEAAEMRQMKSAFGSTLNDAAPSEIPMTRALSDLQGEIDRYGKTLEMLCSRLQSVTFSRPRPSLGGRDDDEDSPGYEASPLVSRVMHMRDAMAGQTGRMDRLFQDLEV